MFYLLNKIRWLAGDDYGMRIKYSGIKEDEL
jgi:hypothetical protein